MIIKENNNWFKGIDSIRFILAFIVMLFHSNFIYAATLKHSSVLPIKILGLFLANAFDGTSAVIAFFIISGFVIHYPNRNGIRNVGEFWIRRLVRIFIPLFLVLIIGAFFDHPEKSVVWSIYCEIIYYALYPLMAKISLSWKNKFIISFAISIILIITLANHDLVALIKQTNNNYHGYYWQFGIGLTWIIGLPCWLLGVIIAQNIDNLNTVNRNSVIFYRLLVFFISVFCCFGKFHLHISYIISMNFFALIQYKWIQKEIIYYKNNQPISTFEKMGKFSYSLYLCHHSLFVILGYYLVINNITYPILIILTVGISFIFYLLVEKPSHLLARTLSAKFLLYKK